MFLRWFNGNQFLKFPAKGMAFKVSCGGCNKYYGGSGYKSILKEIEAVINDRLEGRNLGGGIPYETDRDARRLA